MVRLGGCVSRGGVQLAQRLINKIRSVHDNGGGALVGRKDHDVGVMFQVLDSLEVIRGDVARLVEMGGEGGVGQVS